MLSLIDCLDFIDLDSATIEIIAEHQNMATIVAAELGNQLIADLRASMSCTRCTRTSSPAPPSGRISHVRRNCAGSRRLQSASYPMPRQF